ncbi:MAG: KH domain-containing protein [Candidatus Methylacidiphilales bacterium]
MKYFVDFVIRALVDFPDEVDVEEVETENQILFRVHLNPGDIGKVIGRNGKTIGAIRSVLGAAATKVDKRVSLEVVDLNIAS